MGNLLDNLTSDTQQQYAKNFTLRQNMMHQQLGSIKVLECKDNKVLVNSIQNITVFQKVISATSKEHLEQISNHLKNRKQFQQNNLVKIIYITENDNSMMCTELSGIEITCEYYMLTVNQEAERIISQSQLISESRLWYIAYQIIDACAYLQQKDKYHGDLKSQTIYLDQEKNVKLIEHDFIPGSPDAYNKALTLDEFYFMPPEQLIELKQQNYLPQTNKVLGDVFTLGLILLELAAQQSSAAYYNWAKKNIDLEQIEQRIQSLSQFGYSTIFQKLLEEMVSDVRKRPTFVVIRDGLKKIEQDILSGNQFFINHIKQTSGDDSARKQFQTFGSKI